MGAYLLIPRSRAQALSTIHRSTAEQDIDALTRMLIAETGFTRSRSEMAQIVFVAVNRARRYGLSASQVVDPRRSAFPTWNTGSAYRRRFDDADNNSRWGSARSFVQQVLAGAYSNLGMTKFIHPAAMPTPPCSSTRVAMSTTAGTRCVPEWIRGGKTVGGALFA